MHHFTLGNCYLNRKLWYQNTHRDNTHAPSVFTKTVMSCRGCLVNGSREHQAWRHVIIPTATALYYQLAVMCKHLYALQKHIQVMKGVKSVSKSLKVIQQPFSFPCVSKVSGKRVVQRLGSQNPSPGKCSYVQYPCFWLTVAKCNATDPYCTTNRNRY